MERPKNSAVAGLPDDPLVEILSRLPVKDLHRSKCVSRAWRDLIADPQHHKKLPQTLHGFFPSYGRELGSYINLSGESPPPFDPTFPILTKLPGMHHIWLITSCNGLLLFRRSTWLRQLGYIVFNPATEQWAAVPSERAPEDTRILLNHTCLVFDPAVSHHFHLVIICENYGMEIHTLATMHSYSSETGVWRHTQIDWAQEINQLGHWNGGYPQIKGTPNYATVLNNMLYLLLNGNKIAEVDLEGKTKRIITVPSSVGRRVLGRRVRACCPIFIGQSQGCLYCINEEKWASDIPSELSNPVCTGDSSDDDSSLLSIWVLEDCDTQKWVLKHSVSCLRLFGSVHCKADLSGYDVVAIHPDNNNLVFIVLYQERKLISYGLNSKQVRTVGTFKQSLRFPLYVPCFLDFLSVAHQEEKLGVDQRDKHEKGLH